VAYAPRIVEGPEKTTFWPTFTKFDTIDYSVPVPHTWRERKSYHHLAVKLAPLSLRGASLG
jgi:hypothetical protein